MRIFGTLEPVRLSSHLLTYAVRVFGAQFFLILIKVCVRLKTLVSLAMGFLLISSAWANQVVELQIKGAIGPATADYVSRGISQGQNANLIVIVIDTPGGLDKSMRLIVETILSSKVPIVSYVAPNGSRAASAGTYILYASTVAAMAPSTHLGAASPINFADVMEQKSKNEATKSTRDSKMANDALAYIRSLAQLRNRNPQFAERAVLSASTLTAREALQHGVIDIIAINLNDLLKQLDGMMVFQNGQKIKLATKNAKIQVISPDWRMRFLQVITDPTVAYLMLLLGIYGIFFELLNPGFVLPGVIGGISILLGLYALQLLPINYAGLGLIVLGIVFIIAEAFAPSFGALGVGGTFAFIVGSIMLIDVGDARFQIARSAIGAMAAANLVILMALGIMAIKAKRRKPQHGMGLLLGAEGRTLGPIDRQGQAVINGEIWTVRAQQPIEANKRIKVVATKGLQLEIKEIDVNKA
jgi:membrane-bound serine protease (ClpP class)